MNITIEKTTSPKVKPESSVLGFGKYFTDHMLLMEYTEGKGWHDARIEPFGNISLHPASTVLHYGAEIFEGLMKLSTLPIIGVRGYVCGFTYAKDVRASWLETKSRLLTGFLDRSNNENAAGLTSAA